MGTNGNGVEIGWNKSENVLDPGSQPPARPHMRALIVEGVFGEGGKEGVGHGHVTQLLLIMVISWCHSTVPGGSAGFMLMFHFERPKRPESCMFSSITHSESETTIKPRTSPLEAPSQQVPVRTGAFRVTAVLANHMLALLRCCLEWSGSFVSHLLMLTDNTGPRCQVKRSQTRAGRLLRPHCPTKSPSYTRRPPALS
ncbi:hypothetical protein MHYP_G00291890 [Metynnis hypsauchen]